MRGEQVKWTSAASPYPTPVTLPPRTRRWPDTIYVQATPAEALTTVHVRVVDDDGRVLEEDDCDCFSANCSSTSLGCALTCYIFPLNLTCPRCAYCAVFG